MTTLQLETPRLVLSSPGEGDAGRLLAYAAANREWFARWEELREAEYYTAAYWERLAESMVKRIDAGQEMRFLLLNRNDLAGPIVGQCALTNIVRGPFQAAYLGYSLDHQSWGTGLMREALEQVIRYAFEQIRLHRIMANYMPANERSGRLLRRLGFTVEGYARDYLFMNGRWEDHILTSLTNPDWAEVEKL